jgi:hypothetical protein
MKIWRPSRHRNRWPGPHVATYQGAPAAASALAPIVAPSVAHTGRREGVVAVLDAGQRRLAEDEPATAVSRHRGGRCRLADIVGLAMSWCARFRRRVAGAVDHAEVPS